MRKADNSEYGRADIEVLDDEAVLFKGLPKKQYVWMSHGDLVTQAPAGFEVTATSRTVQSHRLLIMTVNSMVFEFHPEVRNSEYGLDILRRFAFDVCGAKETGRWMTSSICRLMKSAKSVTRRLS